MALFENFPYTNLHELNLDWLIDKLNEVMDSAVLSVNGQTGEVILYQDPSVIFPDVQNATWSFFRTADGVVRGITFSNDGNGYIMNAGNLYKIYTTDNLPNINTRYIQLYSLDDEELTNWNIFRDVNGATSGIEFDADGTAYIMSGNNRYKIFSQHDAPPYPVSSVNGETGSVILYRSNEVRFPDVIDGQDDPPTTYWNIFRYLNNGYYGIQFNTDGTAQIILPNNTKYTIYTTNNLPPYPAEPFIDLDEDILEFVTDASLENWGIVRGTDNGTIGITFEHPSTGGSAYIRYYDSGTDSYITKKLLTIDDIPSSSGVVSINGQQGIVLLNGTNIPRSGNDNTPINDTIDEKAKAENVAYNEPTNTASQNIPAGSFVFWNGGAYVANQAISLGDTLSLTNLDAVPTGGIANALNSNIVLFGSVSVTLPSTGNGLRITLPNGFTTSNCYVVSISIAVSGSWYFNNANDIYCYFTGNNADLWFKDSLRGENARIIFAKPTTLIT